MSFFKNKFDHSSRENLVISQEQILQFLEDQFCNFSGKNSVIPQEQIWLFPKNKFGDFTRTNLVISQEQNFSVHDYREWEKGNTVNAPKSKKRLLHPFAATKTSSINSWEVVGDNESGDWHTVDRFGEWCEVWSEEWFPMLPTQLPRFIRFARFTCFASIYIPSFEPAGSALFTNQIANESLTRNYCHIHSSKNEFSTFLVAPWLTSNYFYYYKLNMSRLELDLLLDTPSGWLRITFTTTKWRWLD